jgi:Glycosyl transferases group 1
MSKTQHILFIGHLWPEPDSSAAGYRTMALINACLDQNWKVSFASVAQPTQWSKKLQHDGINCYSININSQSFDTWIAQLQPDFCIFDRFMTEEQFSWRVEKFCPECIHILDTCDLHFLRRSRQKTVKKQLSNNQLNKELDVESLHSEDSIREISAIYRSDLSLIISSYEMQLLKDEFKINSDLLLYLPFMFEFPKPNLSADFSQRQHFFMIGNFLHDPNWDAVLWCKQKLWPKIRAALPDAQLHIYGAYTPEKARQLHRESDGFYIMGRADNLSQLILNYRVNLVPLRFGAGIKGKIADGFQYGLPCITTPVGAEGMAENHPWGGYICNNEEMFIQSAIQLYSEPDIWRQKQHDGYEIIKNVHNKKIQQQRFIEQLSALKENITKQRRKNFIGSMLKYHLHRSHEFMSRWIEEKNK